MNKLFTKIAGSIIGMAMAIGVGVAVGRGEVRQANAAKQTYTGNFTKFSDGSSYSCGGLTWTVAHTGGSYGNVDGTKGAQVGTSGTPCTSFSLTSPSISSVSKVDVNASTASSGTAKLSISVGGNSYLSNQSLTTTATNYSGTGSSSGAVVISISNTAKAFYLKSFTITYDDGTGSVAATSLSVTDISGLYPGQKADVSVSANPNGADMPESLTYSTSNSSVFTVSNGVVTAVGAGSATLTVKDSSNASVSGTATVTVSNYPTVDSRITVNGSNKYTIYATSNASGSSLNYSLTGVSNNLGTISSGVSGNVDIDVRFDIVSGAYTNTVAFKTGDNKYLGYTSTLAASGNNNLHLVDSVNENSSWVVTDSQVVLARSYGTNLERHMRFNYNNGNPRIACYISTSAVADFVPVSFYEVTVQSITGISVSDVVLYVGHEKALHVSPVPAAASLDGATYTFTSGTPSVATVDSEGMITAVASGSSTITITASVGGNDYSTTATVTVNNYPAYSGVTLNKTYVMSGEFESTEYELTSVDNNIGNVTAVSDSYAKSYVLKVVSGHFANTIAFETPEGTYLKSTKNSTNLTLDETVSAASSWVVEYSSSTYTITSAETYGDATVRQLLLNKNNGNPRIACYTATGTSIFHVTLTESDEAVVQVDSIQSIYSMNTNVSVNTYGIFVGNKDSNNIIVMDGNYGMNIYKNGCGTNEYVENTTILHIVGKTAAFHGLVQIAPTTIEVVQSADVSAPVVYAAQGNETVEYASRSTTVTGVPSVAEGSSGNFSSNAGVNDITLSFALPGSKTVKVFYKKAVQNADTDAYTTIGDAVTNGTEITVKGFTAWYDGFQVQMTGLVEAIENYTAVDFSQDLLDQTDAVCAGWQEGDNNHDALVTIWSNLAGVGKYPSLSSEQKQVLADAEYEINELTGAVTAKEGTNQKVAEAMARYDFLTIKYNLSHFINGRLSNQTNSALEIVNQNNTAIIITVISVLSLTALGGFFFIKKRKEQ